jgi:ribosomal protein L11
MEEQESTADNETEIQAETEATEPQKEGNLTLDEALEIAIEQHETNTAKTAEKVDVPDKAVAEPVTETPEEEIKAPAEFNKAEQEAWNRGDRKGIAAAWQRINSSRLSHINSLETENRRYKEAPPTSRDDDPNAKVVAAIRANPVAAIHQILKVRGLKPEDVFNENVQQTVQRDDTLGTVQSELAELKSWREQQEIERLGNQFNQTFQTLAAEKNAAGEPLLPDLTETEEGYRLAKAIGSLAVSPQLQAAVRFKNPGAGLVDFAREAYKLLGGRVLESSNSSPRSQESTQKHITQAKRARVSSPGRAPGALRAMVSEKKYKDLDGAVERALEIADEQG